MTTAEIIKETQVKIIMNGEADDYPIEEYLKDMDILADLSLLYRKYFNREKEY